MKKTYALLLGLALIAVFVLGIAVASLAHPSPRAEARGETKWRYMTVMMSEEQHFDADHIIVENPDDVEGLTCERHFSVTGLADSDSLKTKIESLILVQEYDDYNGHCMPTDDPFSVEDVILTQVLNAAGEAGWRYSLWLYDGLVFERED